MAKFLKEKVEEFLIYVEETEEQQDGNVGWNNEMMQKIRSNQEFLSYLNDKWEVDREGRDMTRSMQEVQEHQEKIAGSSVILDRLDTHLSNFEEDPFFLKEQLHLFRWRFDFFHKFFPKEAAMADYPHGAVMFPPVSKVGWWWCACAGTTLMPEANLVAIQFNEVAEAAMHMQMDKETPVESMGIIFKQNSPNILGDEFDYRFGLIYDREDEAEEIRCFKIVLDDDDEEDLDLKLRYLQRVLWALHKAGPPPLKELAARRVILDKVIPDLPDFDDVDGWKQYFQIQEDVPQEVLDYIENGPLPNPEELTERGRNVWIALLKEAENLEERAREGEAEMRELREIEAERAKRRERETENERKGFENSSQVDEEGVSDFDDMLEVSEDSFVKSDDDDGELDQD